jgi:hypothetical protein
MPRKGQAQGRRAGSHIASPKDRILLSAKQELQMRLNYPDGFRTGKNCQGRSEYASY